MLRNIILALIVTCGTSRADTAFSSQLPITTPQTTGSCEDKRKECSLLDRSFFCSGDYIDYVFEHCRKTCNLCNYEKWMLFLKGVAGSPGPDLFQLWNSTLTMNQHVLHAQNLTSEFNGHYKPVYSNEWNDFCIDKVKVAIYNNGEEKAYITFNATGADKISWFTSERIISSTWKDIKSSPKTIFSIAGDADTGREFYVSGESSKTDSCDSFGWIMVSTNSTCSLEAGDKKPAFYYAPGTSKAHWGSTNTSSGDVFAIQVHSKCPHYVSKSALDVGKVCKYKNSTHHLGEYWTDGCMNCTCEETSIGYRCKNISCPVYFNIPPGCKLVSVSGKCCAVPDCGQANGFFGFHPMIKNNYTCVYKGRYYIQGATWTDNCSQSCTCTDSKRGMYSCRAICLSWIGMPDSCHMEDQSPSLCCKQPKCPDDIVINIPKAYKDQYPEYNYV